MSDVNTTSYVRPEAARNAVLEELRRWILSGRLQPGDQLIQEEIAATLGTSVVPIREALTTLQSAGLLVHHRNRGFFVTQLSRDELIELCTIRSALESLAVDKALAIIQPDALRLMDELIDAMEQADVAGNLEELIQHDRAFHFALFSASQSPQLLRLIEITWDQTDAYRSAFFLDPAHRAMTHHEHRQIAETARRGDTTALKRLLDEHRLTPIHTLAEAPPRQQA